MTKLLVYTQFFLVILLLFICPPYVSSQGTGKVSEPLKVQNETLENVMRLVANHSGYNIVLLGDHGSSRITGLFNLTDLEGSLYRIFRGTNSFVEFYEKEKKIVVKFPGEGKPILFSGKNMNPAKSRVGKQVNALLAMREREKEIQMERMNDPYEIDPDTGIPYVEQMTMREQEKKNQLERMNNSDEIDPDTGLSYVEQLTIKQREKEAQVVRMSDPDEIDPDTELSYVEQVATEEREKQIQLERMSDPDEIDPDTGLSYVEQLSMREHEKDIMLDGVK